MKQLTGIIAIVLFLLSFFINSSQLMAQCTPTMSQVCDSVQVLCSLDELNGYTCNNSSLVPGQCTPLCSQGGLVDNTSWWGFVSQGGSVEIYITIGGCAYNYGVQYGIWGDCICGEEILCRSIPYTPPGSVSKFTVNLVPCKIYYLWLDGGMGDMCDFTLNTMGGSPPSLVPLGFINNNTNMIIEPVCEGACNVLFFINPQPGGFIA